jgi:hypothetical protein
MWRISIASTVITAVVLSVVGLTPWSAIWLGVSPLYLRNRDSVVRLEVHWSLIEKDATGAVKRAVPQEPIVGTAFVIKEDGFADGRARTVWLGHITATPL